MLINKDLEKVNYDYDYDIFTVASHHICVYHGLVLLCIPEIPDACVGNVCMERGHLIQRGGGGLLNSRLFLVLRCMVELSLSPFITVVDISVTYRNPELGDNPIFFTTDSM